MAFWEIPVIKRMGKHPTWEANACFLLINQNSYSESCMHLCSSKNKATTTTAINSDSNTNIIQLTSAVSKSFFNWINTLNLSWIQSGRLERNQVTILLEVHAPCLNDNRSAGENWDHLLGEPSITTVDGSAIHLTSYRLVVYPFLYRSFFKSPNGGCLGISDSHRFLSCFHVKKNVTSVLLDDLETRWKPSGPRFKNNSHWMSLA